MTSRLRASAPTLLLTLFLVCAPVGGAAQARVQPGDTVLFSLHEGVERTGRVLSVGSEMLTVREGGIPREYLWSELGRLRVRQPVPDAGERAFWKGALVGGVLGAGAGLALALENLSEWDDPDPRGPTNAELVLAVTSGGAILGGLTVGIVSALLAPDHEWISVGVAPRDEASVILHVHISL